MPPDRWSRIEEIFHAARARNPDARAAFLEKACAGDEDLRREVESLLVNRSEGGDLIEAAALDVAAGAMGAAHPAVSAGLTGKTILHYRITEKIGSGGMGVVYKAVDTRLNRSVALKVLPPDRVADPERKRRFVKEARAASALNHPNIVTIHDIGQENGNDFIAMEHVQGKTLADLISRKGMRLNETLRYAVQMADALTAAHEAGIIHRDVKPGNVMVTDKGLVKVLDFGLAKLAEQARPGPEESARTEKPTTESGMIVGTVAYMSPEQAEGKAVDARSDIFSFGAVLYEMVSGRWAFQKESNASTLAAIITQEPEPLPPIVPHDLEKIIGRCLRKDPAQRFQHMDDVKIALEELKEESDSGKLQGPVPAPQRRGRILMWAAAALVLLVAAGIGLWLWRSRTESPPEPLRAVNLTSYAGMEAGPSFSPDGNQVAFSWNGEKKDNFDIYVKLIGPGVPLRLTTDPAQDANPAWSPDGRWIAFIRYSDSDPLSAAVWLIPALGGSERKVDGISLAGQASLGFSLAWTKDGKWLAVSEGARGNEPACVFLLSPESGEKRRLTTGVSRAPALSPDGHQLAFVATGGVYLLNLGKDLQPLGGPKRLTLLNQAIWGIAWTPAGREIVFSSGSQLAETRLWRISTTAEGSSPTPEPLGEDSFSLAVSAGSRRLVYARQSSDADIWRINLRGPGEAAGPPVKLISSTRLDINGEYSPDGRKIAFNSYRSGSEEIWIANADGSHPVQLTSAGGPMVANPLWSPDGQNLVFHSMLGGAPVGVYLISAGGGMPKRVIQGHGSLPNWSRDGKWIYFGSTRSGRAEVWKIPSSGGEPVQITSKGGNGNAFESMDGKFLYYFKSTQIWRIPLGGGEEARIIEGPVSYHMNWFVVEEGIYFISGTPSTVGSPATLYFYSFATAALRAVTKIEAWCWGLTVSPDRRSILFSVWENPSGDLMLVENFR